MGQQQQTFRVVTRTRRELDEGDRVWFDGDVWELARQTHSRKVYLRRPIADWHRRWEYRSPYANVLDVEIIAPDGEVTFALGPEPVTPGVEQFVSDSVVNAEGDQMVLCNVGGTAVVIYTYANGQHGPQVLTFDRPELAGELFRHTADRWRAQTTPTDEYATEDPRS